MMNEFCEATESWYLSLSTEQQLFILHRVHAISWSEAFKEEFFREIRQASNDWCEEEGWPLRDTGEAAPAGSEVSTY